MKGLTAASAAIVVALGMLGALGACGDAPLPVPPAPLDAGRFDAGRDAGRADAGRVDAGVPDGGAVDAGPCTNRSYANFGQSWLQSRCNGCHATVAPKLTTKELLLEHLEGVTASIVDGTMPPPPTTLPASERDIVLKWLGCGAP